MKAEAAAGYAWALDLPPGDFFVLGGVDANGNDMIDDGEPIGIYPTKDSPAQISVTAGGTLENVNFSMVLSKPGSETPGQEFGIAYSRASEDPASPS